MRGEKKKTVPPMWINDEWITSVPLLCQAQSPERLFSFTSDPDRGSLLCCCLSSPSSPPLSPALSHHWHPGRRGMIWKNKLMCFFFFFTSNSLCEFPSMCETNSHFAVFFVCKTYRTYTQPFTFPTFYVSASFQNGLSSSFLLKIFCKTPQNGKM